MVLRRASHAGTWYKEDSDILGAELDSYLADAAAAAAATSTASNARLMGVIAPHAGYSYSGRTAAHSYVAFLTHNKPISRVYVLGPLHYARANVALCSLAHTVCTPFGGIPVDLEEISTLRRDFPHLFQSWNSLRDEEQEHSLEMQFPFIHRTLLGRNESLKIVPIGVGRLSQEHQTEMGQVLATRLGDESSLLVISTDLCHWGSRFNYTRLGPAAGGDTLFGRGEMPIYRSIEETDRAGMLLVEQGNLPGFRAYLAETGNTICGKVPLCILLTIRAQIKFLHYEQSSQCTTMDDSSVSYAAALIFAS